jgi:hypothetical protein
MVGIHGGHDHGDGDLCPDCQFREALGEFLRRAHNEGREEWHWAVGDIRQAMHAALLALDAVDAAAFDPDNDGPEGDPLADAAAVIAWVGSRIEQLRNALVQQRDTN